MPNTNKIQHATAALADYIHIHINNENLQSKLLEFYTDLDNLLGAFQTSDIIWHQLKYAKLALKLVDEIDDNETLNVDDEFYKYTKHLSDAWRAILSPLLATIIEDSPLLTLDETISQYKELFSKITTSYQESETTLINLKKFIDSHEEELKYRFNEQSEEIGQFIELKTNEASDSIIQQAHSNQNSLEIKSKDIEESLIKLKSSAINEYQEHISLLKDVFEQHEEEVANRIQIRIQNAESIAFELNKKINTASEDISELTVSQKNAINKFSKEIRDKIITSIDNASSTSLQEIQLEQAKSLNIFNEQVNKEIGKINDRIDTEIKEFENKKIEITQILGEISAAYQAGANTRQATTEKWSAEILRVLGVIWMIATIFITMKLFNDYIGFYEIPAGKEIPNLGELGIEWFAIRFMTILMLTSPGIYLLKESAAHRTKENLYRQRGTQLSSIGAYLDELKPEERAAIKKELSKNFFSFHDGKTDTQNVPDFVRDMKEAVSIAKSINSPAPRKKSTMFSKGTK